jgi:hypothetical protein
MVKDGSYLKTSFLRPKIISEAPEKSGVEAFARIFGILGYALRDALSLYF